MEAEKKGRVQLNYIWTLDDPKSMQHFLELGVRGIMTNQPSTLKQVLAPYLVVGGRMARPNDRLNFR